MILFFLGYPKLNVYKFTKIIFILACWSEKYRLDYCSICAGVPKKCEPKEAALLSLNVRFPPFGIWVYKPNNEIYM